MVVISETSGGSNDGDPNKKEKEVEKTHKEEENRRNKKLKEKLSYSLPIPDDLTLSCFALVRRCHYQKLSLVCSNFRDIIRSRNLYVNRSNLGRTESVLYAYVRLLPIEKPSWYVLHRQPYRNLPNTLSWRLTLIDSLPPMPLGAAVVTVGSDIYVIGGHIGGRPTSSLILMDCKSCRWSLLPRMRMSRFRAGVGVIDGKIYVIGGCMVQSRDWLEVFDIKEQTWSGFAVPHISEVNVDTEFMTYAVMEKKIYLKGTNFDYAFEPKALSWGDTLRLYNMPAWPDSSCVIDDMLFSINQKLSLQMLTGLGSLEEVLQSPIIVHDLHQFRTSSLKGLQGFPANMNLNESQMENFGGNLVVLGTHDQGRVDNEYNGKKEIWCVEISIEKRGRDNEIWGKVESVAVVFTTFNVCPFIELCRTVTV